MMFNAKNARPFGKPRRPTGKPKLDGWTVGECMMAGATVGDDTYDAWYVKDDKGKPDVVFTKRDRK